MTPNIVMPIAGRSPAPEAARHVAMPATAWAALAITRRLMALSPAMSTTECIMVMSVAPT